MFNYFQALAKANMAKNSAQESSEKVGNALDTVNDILSKLGKSFTLPSDANLCCERRIYVNLFYEGSESFTHLWRDHNK